MVSSALSTLRGIPALQAAVYNEYLPKATKIRQDQYLATPTRLAQLERLVNTATNALQDLQDTANKNELIIRNKAAALAGAAPASEVTAVARDNVMLAWTNSKNNLAAVCGILTSQNDRAGYSVLRSMLPYLYSEVSELERAKASVTMQEQALYSVEEKRTLAELSELETGMPRIRTNFNGWRGTISQIDGLFPFFQSQLLPSAVAGQFKRLTSLTAWPGLTPQAAARLGITWDAPATKLEILLVDDFGHTVNDPVTYTAPASY